MSFKPLDTLATRLQALDAQGLRRQRRSTETACDVRMVVDGRTLLTFNSND